MTRTLWNARGAFALAGAMAMLSAARPAAAQANGTYTIQMYGENGRPPMTMIESRKGNKVRIEMQEGSRGGRGAMIMDNDAHTQTMIVPEKKIYMVMTEADAQRMRGMGVTVPDANEDHHMKIDKTGRTEVVAGVRCDVYHMSGTNDGKLQEGEACIADNAGFSPFAFAGPMAAINRGSGSREMQQLRELLKGNRGIMKITKIENGKATTAMEVVKIDHSTPSDDVFSPPHDFTKMDMPGMGGMGGRPPKP